MTFINDLNAMGKLNVPQIDRALFGSADPAKNKPMNLTGVICTVGPASSTKEKLTEMLNSGMRVARLNFSHGDHSSHGKTIAMLKELRQELAIPFAIALDTKGPEIRTGDLKDGVKAVPIKSDQKITFSNNKAKFGECTAEFVYCDYPALGKLTEGTSIFVDDGNLQFKVTKVGNMFL